MLPNVFFKTINRDFWVKSPGVGEPSNSSFKRELADQSVVADRPGPAARCSLLLAGTRLSHSPGSCGPGEEMPQARKSWSPVAVGPRRRPGSLVTLPPSPTSLAHHRGTENSVKWATRPREGRQGSQAS